MLYFLLKPIVLLTQVLFAHPSGLFVPLFDFVRPLCSSYLVFHRFAVQDTEKVGKKIRPGSWLESIPSNTAHKIRKCHCRWINSSSQKQLSQGASSEQQRDGWPVIAKQTILLIKLSKHSLTLSYPQLVPSDPGNSSIDPQWKGLRSFPSKFLVALHD